MKFMKESRRSAVKELLMIKEREESSYVKTEKNLSNSEVVWKETIRPDMNGFFYG